MKVRKIIAQSRYAQVESQVPVFPFIVQGQVVQWVRQPGQARKGRTGYCEWKWSVISCAAGGWGEARVGDGREIGRAELVAGVLLSAQWSVVRAAATRGARGATGGASWLGQPARSELGQASEPPDVSRCKSKMAASEETQMWKDFMWFSFGIIGFSSFLKAYRGPWDTKNQEITFSRVRVTWEERFCENPIPGRACLVPAGHQLRKEITLNI